MEYQRPFRPSPHPRLRLLSLLLVALSAWGATTIAERLAKEAEKAERSGQVVEAYLLYARAAAADPRNPLYWTKAQSLRAPASMLSERKLPALGQPIDETPVKHPNGIIGTFTRRELDDIDRMTPVPHLKPAPGKKDFHLRGEAKTLFEQLAREYGYAVIFDKDYNLPLTVRFDVTEVDYKGALHALEQATNSFIVPLSERAMLVAQDSVQKRTELEANEALGIPIPQRTSVQEAQELSMMVQQTLELRRVVMDPVKRMIYIRDRASKVELASAILSQLSGSKPQVSVEVEFLSVGRSSSMSFGLTLPTKFPLVNFGSVLRSSPSLPAGFMRFLTFGAGKTFLGMGITDAQLFATASRSDATSLLKSEITASDGLPSILHVGDKYPIQTGAYIGSGGLSGSSGVSTTYATISTASYADVARTNVSTTGKMKISVNGRDFPFTIPAGANSMIGVQNIINSFQLGVSAVTIPRGTPDRPYSLLVVASTLGISSIQLYDDPDGANIKLLKTPDVVSAISLKQYPDRTATKVSSTGALSLQVGSTPYSLALAEVTNTLEGLRDAINHAGAGVTASILSTGIDPNPFYLQVVADQANSGSLQVFDDPTGAHTAMFAETNEVSQGNGTFGRQVLTPSTNFGQTFTPPPTFNFEDLGLVLKITPFVHDQNEVTLEVEAEFKVLGTGSYNGVPVISTRKFQGKLRLRTSEYAVVAGLMSDTQARSISGLAGVSQIPLLGPLLSDNERTHDTSQVLIVIKPRVTSLPPSEFVTRTFWFGSEMKPLTIL